jgi:hypothetical protein
MDRPQNKPLPMPIKRLSCGFGTVKEFGDPIPGPKGRRLQFA